MLSAKPQTIDDYLAPLTMIGKLKEAASDKYRTPTRRGSVFVVRKMNRNTWPVPN